MCTDVYGHRIAGKSSQPTILQSRDHELQHVSRDQVLARSDVVDEDDRPHVGWRDDD